MPLASASPFVTPPPLLQKHLTDYLVLKSIVKRLPQPPIITSDEKFDSLQEFANKTASASACRTYASHTADLVYWALQKEIFSKVGSERNSMVVGTDYSENLFAHVAASLYAQSVLSKASNPYPIRAHGTPIITSTSIALAPSSTLLDGHQLAHRIHNLVQSLYAPMVKVIISVVAQLSASANSHTASAGARSSTTVPESLRSLRHSSAISLEESATKRLIKAVSPPSSPVAQQAAKSDLETSFVKYFSFISKSDDVTPPIADLVSVLHQVHIAMSGSSEPHTITSAFRVALADWLLHCSADGSRRVGEADITRRAWLYLLESIVPSTLVDEMLASRPGGGGSGSTDTGKITSVAALSTAEVAYISSLVKDTPELLDRCATFLMLQHYFKPEEFLPRVVLSALEQVLLSSQLDKQKEGLDKKVKHEEIDVDQDNDTPVRSKRRRAEDSTGSKIKVEGVSEDIKVAAVPLPSLHLMASYPHLFSFNSISARFAIRAYIKLVSAGSDKIDTVKNGAILMDKEIAMSTISPCLASVFVSDECSRFLLTHGATSLSDNGKLFSGVVGLEANGDDRSNANTTVKLEGSDEKRASTIGTFLYSGKPPPLGPQHLEAFNRRCTQDFLLRLVNQFESCEGAALFKDPVYPSTIMNHSGAQLGPYSAVIKVPMSLATMRSCIIVGAGGEISGGKSFAAAGGKAADGETIKKLTSPTSANSKVPFPICTLAEMRKALWLIAANCATFNAPEGPFPEKARVFVNLCCKIVDRTVEMMATVEA